MHGVAIQTAAIDADIVPDFSKADSVSLVLFGHKRRTAVISHNYGRLPGNSVLSYGHRKLRQRCVASFEYSGVAYKERFEKAGLMALLGCGFDLAQRRYSTSRRKTSNFDEMHHLILLIVTPEITEKHSRNHLIPNNIPLK
jgi:saccharopine dehydrogenase (NAD+, L-lysine-forming)